MNYNFQVRNLKLLQSFVGWLSHRVEKYDKTALVCKIGQSPPDFMVGDEFDEGAKYNVTLSIHNHIFDGILILYDSGECTQEIVIGEGDFAGISPLNIHTILSKKEEFDKAFSWFFYQVDQLVFTTNVKTKL